MKSRISNLAVSSDIVKDLFDFIFECLPSITHWVTCSSGFGLVFLVNIQDDQKDLILQRTFDGYSSV